MEVVAPPPRSHRLDLATKIPAALRLLTPAEPTLMFLLITYDVSTREERAGARRLRRVAKACTSYGVRVQKSVFEMQLGQKEWVELKARLLAEIDVERDSLRVYFIDQSG